VQLVLLLGNTIYREILIESNFSRCPIFKVFFSQLRAIMPIIHCTVALNLFCRSILVNSSLSAKIRPLESSHYTVGTPAIYIILYNPSNVMFGFYMYQAGAPVYVYLLVTICSKPSQSSRSIWAAKGGEGACNYRVCPGAIEIKFMQNTFHIWKLCVY
jgi:hypothetical protein